MRVGGVVVSQRVVIAIVASFPVAVVAGLSLGLAIDLGGALSTAFFWLVWGGSVFYALREMETKRVFGRTAIAYAVAAFSLPVTATVFAINVVVRAENALEGSIDEAEGPVEAFLTLLLGAALIEVFLIMGVVLGVFGLLTGLIAVFLARSSLKKQVGQESEEIRSA